MLRRTLFSFYFFHFFGGVGLGCGGMTPEEAINYLFAVQLIDFVANIASVSIKSI